MRVSLLPPQDPILRRLSSLGGTKACSPVRAGLAGKAVEACLQAEGHELEPHPPVLVFSPLPFYLFNASVIDSCGPSSACLYFLSLPCFSKGFHVRGPGQS